MKISSLTKVRHSHFFSQKPAGCISLYFLCLELNSVWKETDISLKCHNRKSDFSIKSNASAACASLLAIHNKEHQANKMKYVVEMGWKLHIELVLNIFWIWTQLTLLDPADTHSYSFSSVLAGTGPPESLRPLLAQLIAGYFSLYLLGLWLNLSVTLRTGLWISESSAFDDMGELKL